MLHLQSIFVGEIEVLPARATAKASEVTCVEQSRAHFGFIISGILRDEFGNLAPSDAGPTETHNGSNVGVSVELEGCALSPQDVSVFPERNGTFSVIFVPKRSGDASFKVPAPFPGLSFCHPFLCPSPRPGVSRNS